MPSAKNIAIVHQLEEQLTQAKVLVLADYRGLTVKDMQALRAQIRAAGGTLTVAKNTLIQLALKNEALNQALRGPTALISALEDTLAPIKALVDFAQNHALNLPQPKAGLLNNQVLTPSDINLLASIPSRDQLLAQLVGQLQAPFRNLVYVLSQVRSTRR